MIEETDMTPPVSMGGVSCHHRSPVSYRVSRYSSRHENEARPTNTTFLVLEAV